MNTIRMSIAALALALSTNVALATDHPDIDIDWSLETLNVTSVFGPAGTDVQLGNLTDGTVHIVAGDVLDVTQQAIGTTMFTGTLGADGLPNDLTTGIMTLTVGEFTLDADGIDLCLGDCTPPAE